jgi:hypothetical protein
MVFHMMMMMPVEGGDYRSSPSQCFNLAICQGIGSTYYLEQLGIGIVHIQETMLIKVERSLYMFMYPGLCHHKRNRIILRVATWQRTKWTLLHV